MAITTLDTRPAGRTAAPILAGAMLAGTIDLVFACTYNGIVSGVAPARVLQAIASGLLGRAAFEQGAPAAALGFVAHYAILIVAAAMFYAASRRLGWLREHAYASGVAFGVAIFATMRLVVLPLSAAPHFKSSPQALLADFAVHALLLGPAIALSVRYFDRRRSRRDE